MYNYYLMVIIDYFCQLFLILFFLTEERTFYYEKKIQISSSILQGRVILSAS